MLGATEEQQGSHVAACVKLLKGIPPGNLDCAPGGFVVLVRRGVFPSAAVLEVQTFVLGCAVRLVIPVLDLMWTLWNVYNYDPPADLLAQT